MKWVKIILCFIIFVISCKKTEISTSHAEIDIFQNQTVTVTDGQSIQFNLKTTGKYTLNLYDSTINEIVSKEKFNGIAGINNKTIHTSTFTQKSLYLYLTDSVGNQIGKTKITIN